MSKSYPPLHQAVHEGNFGKIEAMLSRLDDIDKKREIEKEVIRWQDMFAWRPIHFAADYANDGTAAGLIILLARNGADVNAKTRDCRDPDHPASDVTPLHMAVSIKRHAAVLALLSYGADPNIPYITWTSLHLAASIGDPLMIHILCGYSLALKRVVVDGRGGDDMTPLMVAAEYGRSKACKALFDYGARLDLVNSKGKTALQIAVEAKHTETADMLRALAAGIQAVGIASVVPPEDDLPDGPGARSA